MGFYVLVFVAGGGVRVYNGNDYDSPEATRAAAFADSEGLSAVEFTGGYQVYRNLNGPAGTPNYVEC